MVMVMKMCLAMEMAVVVGILLRICIAQIQYDCQYIEHEQEYDETMRRMSIIFNDCVVVRHSMV